ncbi:hypothetical protein JOC34_000574 [Virgibacillus halotolerans]|uniref:AAA family ATPase n=1 Tax=Virgibacillus halotolerans TaxID=1071053 RepID=UPI00195FF771|nr:AAA family ATPase [Virgibacillus halotolerans]MBM7598217.1 hypothetical protein [Virgibacillus halotolerans]
MAFVKPDKKKEGTKFLFYGYAGSGKTPTGLSFPNIALVDSDSGTNFYDLDNVVVNSSTLSFKELNDDLDELEMDDELFESIETFTVDSLTRFHNNMIHAMNKIAEKRAVKNSRDAEGEGLSFKEYGKMKTYYGEFFARMLNFAKQGKHLVFIAEQKDQNENSGGEIKKIGVMPDGQKKIEHDFDVVVRTFNDENGKPKGLVEKDRTGTYKIGETVDKPNYQLWKPAMDKALKGKQRKKEEIKSLKDVVKDEIEVLDDGESLKEELRKAADAVIKSGKTDELKANLEGAVGTIKYKTLTELEDIKKALEAVKSIK